MLQKEGICHAQTIAAFSSSCQVNLGLLPFGSTLAPPHTVEKRHCFLITYTCTWWHFSRPSSLPCPSSWPGAASLTLLPLSMPLGNSCRARGWHLSHQAARWYRLCPFFVWHPCRFLHPRRLHASRFSLVFFWQSM